MAITKVHTHIANSSTSIAGFPNSARAVHGTGFETEVFGTNTGFGARNTDGTGYFEVLDALPEWYLREQDNIDRAAAAVRIESDVTGTAGQLHLNTDDASTVGEIWKDVRMNRGDSGSSLLLFADLGKVVSDNAESEAVVLEEGDEITQDGGTDPMISGQILAVSSGPGGFAHFTIQQSAGVELRHNIVVAVANGISLHNAENADTATFAQNIDATGASPVAVPVADRKIKPVGADLTP